METKRIKALYEDGHITEQEYNELMERNVYAVTCSKTKEDMLIDSIMNDLEEDLRYTDEDYPHSTMERIWEISKVVYNREERGGKSPYTTDDELLNIIRELVRGVIRDIRANPGHEYYCESTCIFTVVATPWESGDSKFDFELILAPESAQTKDGYIID